MRRAALITDKPKDKSYKPFNVGALQTMQALLSSIPTFLGADLARIIAVCVKISATGVENVADVLEAISVNIPSRVLLTTLVGLWNEEYSVAPVGQQQVPCCLLKLKSWICHLGEVIRSPTVSPSEQNRSESGSEVGRY